MPLGKKLLEHLFDGLVFFLVSNRRHQVLHNGIEVVSLLLGLLVGAPDEPNPRITECCELSCQRIIRVVGVEEGDQPKARKSKSLKDNVVDVLVAKAEAHDKQDALFLDDLSLKLAEHVRVG